jgi:predicted ATPase
VKPLAIIEDGCLAPRELMISAIQVKNFKGIRYMDRLELGPFHILVGPNGSGKSTFLDAIEFVRSCLQDGPRKAVEDRVPDYRDLTFMRQGGTIEIDFWLDLNASLPNHKDSLLHYRVAFVDDEELGVRAKEELLERVPVRPKQKGKRLAGFSAKGSAFYQREDGKYIDSFAFGSDKLALSLTPPDEKRYPTANSAKAFLMQGIRFIQLNSRAMREPCPATRPTELEPDGTNLARVVGLLIRRSNQPNLFSEEDGLERWTNHLRYALDDLQRIGWATREPDNAEYVILKYAQGLECPSWLLSDGTLRMLALTLPAFLPATARIYMVEEPENGIHPNALEITLKALAAIPNAQVFIATHSPLVVQQEGKGPLLCFTRGYDGVRIIPGTKHPALQDWKGVPDLASIFSSRVLG